MAHPAYDCELLVARSVTYDGTTAEATRRGAAVQKYCHTLSRTAIKVVARPIFTHCARLALTTL